MGSPVMEDILIMEYYSFSYFLGMRTIPIMVILKLKTMDILSLKQMFQLMSYY